MRLFSQSPAPSACSPLPSVFRPSRLRSSLRSLARLFSTPRVFRSSRLRSSLRSLALLAPVLQFLCAYLDGVLDGASDAANLEAAAVAHVDDLGGGAAAGHKDLAALLDQHLDALEQLGRASEDVDAERPAREALDLAQLGAQALRAHQRAQASKAAGVGHRRRQARERHAAHASELPEP